MRTTMWMSWISAAVVIGSGTAWAGKPGGGGGGTADHEIAFNTGGSSGKIALATSTGGSATTIGSGVSGLAEPNWSPDGTMLVFNGTTTKGGTGIYVMNRDGTGLKRIATTASQWVSGPAWSPATAGGSSWILFEDDDSGHRDVFAVRPDGTGRVNLTNTSTRDESSPTWRSDATQFAVVTGWNDGGGWADDVFVYDFSAAGGTPTATVNRNATQGTALARGDLAHLDWARTKDVLALSVLNAASRYEICTFDLGSGVATSRGAVTGASDTSPSWSPDDSAIVWRRTTASSTESGVYVMSADGTGATRILASPATLPDWRR